MIQELFCAQFSRARITLQLTFIKKIWFEGITAKIRNNTNEIIILYNLAWTGFTVASCISLIFCSFFDVSINVFSTLSPSLLPFPHQILKNAWTSERAISFKLEWDLEKFWSIVTPEMSSSIRNSVGTWKI